MASRQDVQNAVYKALQNDGKQPDDTKVMEQVPYAYNTPDMMKGFLRRVAALLPNPNPPPKSLLSLAKLNVPKCMQATLSDFITYLFMNLD